MTIDDKSITTTMFTYDEDHNFSGFWFYKDNGNVSYIVNDKGEIVSSNSESFSLESSTFVRRVNLNEGEIGKTQNDKNNERIVYIGEKVTVGDVSLLYDKNTLEIIKSGNVNYIGNYYVEFNKSRTETGTETGTETIIETIQLIVDSNLKGIIYPVLDQDNPKYNVVIDDIVDGTIGINFNIMNNNNLIYAYRSKNIIEKEFAFINDNGDFIVNDVLLGVHLAPSVKTINNSAFRNCVELRGVINIPYGVTTIGAFAFYNCDGLTKIIIPDSVKTIENAAFSNSGGLTEIIIPDSVTTMGDSAFFYCNNLEKVIISNSIETINKQVFWDCGALEEIEIPSNVKIIEENAFYNCIGLTKVIIPNNIENIDSTAFTNCNSINTIIITNYNEVVNDNDGNGINDKIESALNINDYTKGDKTNNTITFTKI